MAIFRVIFRSWGYSNLRRLSPKNNLKRLDPRRSISCTARSLEQGADGFALVFLDIGWVFGPLKFNRYRPKDVLGKGVGNGRNASEMRQKCARNAPKMGLVLLGKEERSKNVSEMRQKCVKNAWGGTPFGRYRFKTIAC